MTVRVGIAGWIDKSLIDSGQFYPMNAKSSEERLQFYASQFSLVEVDSTYYGMPKKENSDLWVARTPAGFVFDVKSFSLFTNHPTKPMALPKDIREQLPEKLREKNIYLEQMPPELVDESWERFREALEPLRTAGLRRHFIQARRGAVPRSKPRDLGAQGRSAQPALPPRLLRSGADGVGAPHQRDGEIGQAGSRADEQQLLQLFGQERQAAGEASRSLAEVRLRVEGEEWRRR